MRKLLHVIVKGRVQGISYRYGCIKKAQSLQITGQVKNLSNGDVEVYAEGEKKDLDLLLSWCSKGPTFAKVEDLIIAWGKETKKWTLFEAVS